MKQLPKHLAGIAICWVWIIGVCFINPMDAFADRIMAFKIVNASDNDVYGISVVENSGSAQITEFQAKGDVDLYNINSSSGRVLTAEISRETFDTLWQRLEKVIPDLPNLRSDQKPFNYDGSVYFESRFRSDRYDVEYTAYDQVLTRGHLTLNIVQFLSEVIREYIDK